MSTLLDEYQLRRKALPSYVSMKTNFKLFVTLDSLSPKGIKVGRECEREGRQQLITLNCELKLFHQQDIGLLVGASPQEHEIG